MRVELEVAASLELSAISCAGCLMHEFNPLSSGIYYLF